MLEVIDMEEIMDLWSCPKNHCLEANIIRVISGIGQETLISVFGNMLTRCEVGVDQNGWAFVKNNLWNWICYEYILFLKYDSFTLQQIKSSFYENILFIIKKVSFFVLYHYPGEYIYDINDERWKYLIG